MDDVDLANEVSARELRLRLRGRGEDREMKSFSLCVDCGGEIPLGRQRAIMGCTRCRDCQARHERGFRG